MRLILCEDNILNAFEIEKTTQLYWTPRSLKILVRIINHGIKLEIEGGHFENGVCHFEMLKDCAVVISGENFQVTCIFQKKARFYQRYYLTKNSIFIGREDNCDIVYFHPTISKKHCLIYNDELWYVKDLDSVNGVYVDGKKSKESPLNIGSCIVISGFEMWYCGCFLYIMQPDLCCLSPFTDFVNKPFITKIEPSDLILKPKKPDEPKLNLPLKNSQSIKDVLLMLVFPSVMLLSSSESTTYYAYGTVIVVLIRVIDILISKMLSRKKVEKQDKIYQSHVLKYHEEMLAFYPNCFNLEKQSLYFGGLMIRNQSIVRIGLDSNGDVLLHYFSEYPHLMIKGNIQKANNMVKQIIYQLGVYDPKTAVALETMTDDYCFCASLHPTHERMLWVGQAPIQTDNNHYWIEIVQDYHRSLCGFDALIDLDENHYYTSQCVVFIPDDAFNPYLFSHHYAMVLASQATQKFTYLGLLGLEKMNVEEIRSHYYIEQQLIGCIGCLGISPIYLDLHEKKDGPHLLIAGMTGSGKSEWMISYLFSLAVFYDSEDVQFFFIDFKGGGLAQIFEHLKHTTMILTDLEPLQMTRAIAALEDEVKEREQLLLEVAREHMMTNLNIHDLKHLYRLNQTDKNLAHLIIVVDEFAELKLMYPEVMTSLIRIARVGRSLGIHLILSTQRPSGVVDGQMISNMKTKIVLKVSTKQDSYDLLGRSDAALLKEPGEFYCQKEAQGQLIYGRSLQVKPQHEEIVFLDIDWKEKARLPLNKTNDIPLAMLIENVNEVSNTIKPLYYKDFIHVSPLALKNGCLGVYDDYHSRQMIFWYHNFLHDGPLLVVGASQKTLQILLSHFSTFHHITSLDMPENLPEQLIIENFSKWYLYDYALLDKILKHQCIFIEQDASLIQTRFFEKFSVSLIFDKRMAERLFTSRIVLSCDNEKHIGILVRKDTSYRCQIQSLY